jgi:hypothetical protein
MFDSRFHFALFTAPFVRDFYSIAVKRVAHDLSRSLTRWQRV